MKPSERAVSRMPVPLSSMERRAAAMRSTASVKSNNGSASSPLESSIDRPATPVVVAILTLRATSVGIVAKPSSKSALTGTSTASAIERRWAMVSFLDTLLSRLPSDHASPELVVASAGNPSCSSTRALPTSHGLGMTKQPLSCRRRKTARESVDEFIVRIATFYLWGPRAASSRAVGSRSRIDGNDSVPHPLGRLQHGRHVFSAEEPLAHQGIGGAPDLVEIVLPSGVTFRDRQPAVAAGEALLLRSGERLESADESAQISEIAQLRDSDIPPGVGAKWYGKLRQPDPRDVVAIGVDLRDEHAIRLAGLWWLDRDHARRGVFRPVVHAPYTGHVGRERERRHFRELHALERHELALRDRRILR